MDADDTYVVTITIVRSGGFAGMTQRWSVAATAAQAPRWIALVERCPWDDGEPATPRGADRFTWSVHAVTDGSERTAVVTDADLSTDAPSTDGHAEATSEPNPWRRLIDAVRADDQRSGAAREQ